MIRPKTFDIQCAGYAVKADFYENTSTDHIVLSLIGWTSNRQKYSDILHAICANTGASALVFDYTGHGDSSYDVNATRPAQHFLEVICVFDWLKENYPHAKITVMGTSYGGYLAVQLTKYRAFENLILRVPAIYDPADFYTVNGVINSDEGWEAKDAYRRNTKLLAQHPLLARASNFKGKTLVVVHELDEQVPKETTDAFIHALHADVFVAKDFPHSISTQPADKVAMYQTAISDWINKTRYTYV